MATPGAKKPFAHHRVILTGAAFFVAAAAALVAFYLATTSTLNYMTRIWAQQKDAALEAVLDGQLRQSLAHQVKQYAVWDETVNFVRHPDQDWATHNLDWLVRNKGVSGVAVLTREGQQVHRTGVLETWPEETVNSALQHLTRSLLERPADEVMLYQPEENALYWLAASRIVSSGDKERLGHYTGFLVFARQISPEDLAYLGRATGVYNVALHSPPASTNLALRLNYAEAGAQKSVESGLLPLHRYIGPPGVALAYDVYMPMAETELSHWRVGTVLSVAFILLAVAGSLATTYRLAVRPFLSLSAAVSEFIHTGRWDPPAPRYREVQLVTDTFTEALEQRLAAERNERQRADELQLILDHLPACVFFKDAEGRYVTANRQMAELLGVPESALVGKTCSDFFSRDFAEELRRQDDLVLFTGERVEVEQQTEIGGRRLQIRMIKVPLHSPTGDIIGLVGLGFDMTEKRELEEALRQAQKLEAVGQLSGGIAHDFNNILTSILTGVDLALAQVPAGEPLHDDLSEVRTAAEKASLITRQLLLLSRSREPEKHYLDCNELIATFSSLLHRLLGEDITVNLGLNAETATVLADRVQIEQILLNLALNARDAMPGGGTLAIRTATIGESDLLQHAPDLKPSAGNPPYLLISVQDTGKGMLPEVQARVFEPFFTTKRDHGTGLGLAIAQRIARDHQGHIWLESVPDQGSTFHVALPLASEPQAAAPRQDRQEEMASGDEIVLVVEDDEAVRSLTERVLHKQGYRTVIASSPKEALAILETLPQPPVLLFSDVVMPEMNGLELAQTIKKRIPSLKVLLTSGYPNEAIAARGIEDNGYRILPKPYTPATLTQAIREALDGG